MDKEHRKRAAVREFIVEDPGGDAEETTYVVRVSGDQAELVRGELHPWDNEHGTGKDETWQSWPMATNDLKKLIEHAQIAIKWSEDFEAKQAGGPVDGWQALKEHVQAMRLPELQREINETLQKKED